MRSRAAAAFAVLMAMLMLTSGTAGAATGPPRMQRLAEEQTQLLMRHLNKPFGEQTASPRRCNQGQDEEGTRGTFLLPTLSFGSGNATFYCEVETRTVLVDLGGAVAMEDARFDDPDEPSFYDFPGEGRIEFTRANLERICDDVLATFFRERGPAPATVDGRPLTGETAVSTAVFTSRVRPGATVPYQDSVDLGHPGRLATAYCGWKALVPLSEGEHVITVDLSTLTGKPTVFTYKIDVDD